MRRAASAAILNRCASRSRPRRISHCELERRQSGEREVHGHGTGAAGSPLLDPKSRFRISLATLCLAFAGTGKKYRPPYPW